MSGKEKLTQEEVEVKRLHFDAYKVELIVSAIKTGIKALVWITFIITSYFLLIEMLKTPNNERVVLVSEFVKTLLSERGVLGTFMPLAGWAGCAIFACTTFGLIYWGRKRDIQYDKCFTLTEGGCHESIADSSSCDA